MQTVQTLFKGCSILSGSTMFVHRNFYAKYNKNSAKGYVAPGNGHVTSSDNALYLYQVLRKHLIGYRITYLDSRVYIRVVANVD